MDSTCHCPFVRGGSAVWEIYTDRHSVTFILGLAFLLILEKEEERLLKGVES